MGSGRSASGGTVFLFKTNLVYIVNYFMFVPPNIYWYEKFEGWLTDFTNDWFVSKPVSAGHSKGDSER